MLHRAGHLTRRFFGSLAPRRVGTADLSWVRTALTPPEDALWSRLSRADQRHALGVARRVQATLRSSPYADDDRWIAAALLHDVGKLESGLGTLGRVGATLVRATVGSTRVSTWSDHNGTRSRIASYARHPELGADRIEDTGGRPEVATWARIHHQADVVTSTVPPLVVEALRAADDD
jgi:hypothetical protein